MAPQRVRIEDEQIEVVKNWPELKSMRDIQVFLGFANFYQRFIQSFSKITRLLTSMLQTSSITRLLKNLPLAMDVVESDEVGGSNSGNHKDRMVKRSPCSKNSNGATGYLIPNNR